MSLVGQAIINDNWHARRSFPYRSEDQGVAIPLRHREA